MFLTGILKFLLISLSVFGAQARLRSEKRDFCSMTLPPHQIPGGNYTNVTIISNGIERSYLITIPSRYYKQKSAPVILSYHGGSRDALRQLQLSQFSNAIFNDYAIAVYPNGINATWQGTPGQIPADIDDVQFTSDILDFLERNYCIDTNRIFASGKSNGGGFTAYLACNKNLSRRIAAFAPVSGSYYVKNKTICDADTITYPCNPGRPKLPILIFHGAKDNTISYHGGPRKGECLPTIPNFVHGWVVREQLGTHNWTSRIGVDTNVFKYGTGLDYGLVTLVEDTVIDHDWPSTEPNGDNMQEGRIGPASFNATPIILDFFTSHPLHLR